MFEKSQQDMKAIVFVESGIYGIATASNVGVSPEIIFEGGNEYDFISCLAVINALGKAVKCCPKNYIKRLEALRHQFIFSFGPEMEAEIAKAEMVLNNA